MQTPTPPDTAPPSPLLSSPAIDWPAVQDQIQQTPVAIEQGHIFTAEEKLAVLKARARTFAQTSEETATVGLQVDVTEFILGNETYAFPSTVIREVCPLKGLTPLPCTPSFLLGIINVRGRILPIVDLTSLLGIASHSDPEQQTAILLTVDDLEVGVVTPLVIGVRSLPLSSIHPPFSTLLANSHARYLQGITPEGIIVLDAEKLLKSLRLGTQEQGG